MTCVTCECGNPIDPKRVALGSGKGRRPHCSRECTKRAAQAAWRRRKMIERLGTDHLPEIDRCVGCGRPYSPRAWRQKFCEQACRDRHYSRAAKDSTTPDGECAGCGRSVPPGYSVCPRSPRCASRVRWLVSNIAKSDNFRRDLTVSFASRLRAWERAKQKARATGAPIPERPVNYDAVATSEED